MIRDQREDAMKAEYFQGLVEQLGNLTKVQRTALQAALEGKGVRVQMLWDKRGVGGSEALARLG